MTEGTKSYLIGCHQFLLHPLWVLLTWRLEYKSWPKWWELIAILFHDIGICGRQYLSDDTAKIGHWEKGAQLTSDILDKLTRDMSKENAGYNMCAGHSSTSELPESKLWKADKRSKLVEPKWWSAFYSLIEPQLKGDPDKWRETVKENLRQKKPVSNHELYMRNRQNESQS